VEQVRIGLLVGFVGFVGCSGKDAQKEALSSLKTHLDEVYPATAYQAAGEDRSCEWGEVGVEGTGDAGVYFGSASASAKLSAVAISMRLRFEKSDSGWSCDTPGSSVDPDLDFAPCRLASALCGGSVDEEFERDLASKREAAAKAAKLDELKRRIAGPAYSLAGSCDDFYEHGNVPHDLCEAFAQAISDGRTTSETKRTLKSYLKERGYFRLRGFIVAQVGDNLYEIARSGHRTHALLATNMTSYSSRGTFSLWAKKEGSQMVDTKDGFTQEWSIYHEDAFGSVVQAVFDARGGEPTSQAARVAFTALLFVLN